MSDLPEGAPAPRLCHLIKWPDFNGYGFNLHADKSKVGQYIGKVDEDSPAEYAGLREGDRIIEVNGDNITKENHRQVVERIKAVENETKLLVVDMEADKWYNDKKIVVHSSQSNVIYMKTPESSPSGKENETPNVNDSPDGLATSKLVINENSNNELPSETEQSENLQDASLLLIKNHVDEETTKTQEELLVKDESLNSTPQPTSPKIEDSNGSTGSTASLPESPQSAKSSHSQKDESQNEEEKSSTQNNTACDLNLNMSVSEIKRMIQARKKNDPKKFQMDWNEKYAVMQQM